MSFADLLNDDDFKPASTAASSAEPRNDFPFFAANADAEPTADTTEEIDRLPVIESRADDEMSGITDMARKPRSKATKARAAGKAPKTVNVVAPEPADELIAGRWTRQVALRKIQEARLIPSMQEKLADVMKLPTTLQLIKKTDEELTDIINEMEIHLAARNGLGEMIKNHVVPKALDGYEKILIMLGVPVKGVADLLMTSPEFKADIDELIWKRVSYSNWPVEIRLIISLVASTTAIVTANMKARAFGTSADISSINEQFRDL